MSWWLAALAGPTFLVVWVAGLVDLTRRRDLTPARRLAWAAAIVVVTPVGAVLYALSRPVRVDRVVVGAPVEEARRGPRGVSRLGIRLVQQAARIAARGLFRSVEVVRPASVATRGPQLWCASHFGALSDPIVLLHALERQPRFLVADFLWRWRPVGWLLDTLGAIPVRRAKDGAGPQPAMFAASRRSLRDGEALCVFPEGLVSERPAIAPLRTGAARIALGARAEGTAGIQVVPVGVHYQDRAALRARVYVDIGEPLDLDDWLRAQGPAAATGSEEDRALVRALTDELEHRLREVAPQFTDLEEATALLTAAHVALTGPDTTPPGWAAQAELADELGRWPAHERAEVVDAVRVYRAELDAAGLGEADVVGRPARSRRRLLLEAVVGLVLLPVAVAGAVVHAPLAALVRASARWPRSPATKATVRPLLAVLGALATWLAWGWALTLGMDGWQRAGAVLTWLLVLPVWGAAALVVTERVVLAAAAVRRRRPVRRARDALDAVRADRDRVVALVRAGPAGATGTGTAPGG